MGRCCLWELHLCAPCSHNHITCVKTKVSAFGPVRLILISFLLADGMADPDGEARIEDRDEICNRCRLNMANESQQRERNRKSSNRGVLVRQSNAYFRFLEIAFGLKLLMHPLEILGVSWPG